MRLVPIGSIQRVREDVPEAKFLKTLSVSVSVGPCLFRLPLAPGPLPGSLSISAGPVLTHSGADMIDGPQQAQEAAPVASKISLAWGIAEALSLPAFSCAPFRIKIKK